MDKNSKKLFRSLFDEFVKNRGLVTSGYCPQCELENKEVAMYRNHGDLFECPTCHLMISLATAGRATIIRNRGQGMIKSFDKYYCATSNMTSMNLSREKDNTFESDGSMFTNTDELKEYLDTIGNHEDD